MEPVDVASVVERVTSAIAERTIDIPEIIVTPKGEVTVGYQDFDLDCTSFLQAQPRKVCSYNI
jgi:type III restriction enzyme